MWKFQDNQLVILKEHCLTKIEYVLQTNVWFMLNLMIFHRVNDNKNIS